MPRDPARGNRGESSEAHGTETATVERLDPATVDRIAAGEVITRPARVITELIDNALDADATHIAIAVEGDGTDRIRVSDDGHGMSREDARRAVQRHTTSKLASNGDPVGIDSLGFRGEGLAAIADAGRLTLTTNDGGAVGTQVVVAGDSTAGESAHTADPRVSDAGRGRGTTAVVDDLFATRPARRESLATPAAEFARISSRVADYALARPAVAFTLEHDGSTTLSTPGTGLADAILGVYDRETASRSTTISGSIEADVYETTESDHRDEPFAVSVTGVLAYPSITRATRDHVRLSVNGRPVRNERLAAAVRSGYGRLLADGREPVAAVNVSVPANRVDPNVHPAKRTVGLHGATRIASAIETVVGDALTGVDLRRHADVDTDLETALTRVGADEGRRKAAFAEADPIGVFRDLYLLVESADGLLVIDGHAAHERVNYERLARAFEDEPIPTADLNPPATVSLSAGEAAAAEAHAETLATLGFETEPFGGGTRRLTTVPAPFGRTADADAFGETLTAVSAGESPRDARDALLADLACHPSLRRGQIGDLTEDDQRALLNRLGECERPYACPHGRPTVLSVEEATVAAAFEREH